MKTSPDRAALQIAASPLFLNTGFPLRPTFPQKVRPPARVDAVLNGELLGGQRSYGFTTQPQPSPGPLDLPLGVEALAVVNESARRAANQAAREALHAGSRDLPVLAAYSGGGGIGESVDEFYTPRTLADALWAMAGPLQPGAAVLDPACGIGNLLVRAPAGLRLSGCELSTESSRIAQMLLPEADIRTLPFEAYQLGCADALYDAVVLNPPYGPRSMRHLDQRHVKANEAYFTLGALERVRHGGGVVAMLVNANLVQGQNHQGWRDQLSRLGRVVHAALVPEGAFRDAGAGVTTALLTVRRHDLGVKEALETLTPEQCRTILDDYDAWNGRGWVEGTLLIREREQDGATRYELTDRHASARRLGSGQDLAVGRFGQPVYPGALDASKLPKITDVVRQALSGAGVTLPAVLESVRVQFGEEAFEGARVAASQASSTPIPLGRTNPDQTWVYTLGGWQPCDDFARPEVADALQVAAAVGRVLKRQPGGDPVAGHHARRLALQLDSQYRRKHGGYDVTRLSRLAPRFTALALLISHLKDGTLVIPEAEKTSLVLEGTLADIAGQLANLLLLDETTLSEQAGVGRPEALKHLIAHYAFTGDGWTDRGSYYSGHALRRSDHARKLAEQHAEPYRSLLLSQADGFLRRVQPIELKDLTLSPRDPVIPLATLQAWVNALLGSVRRDAGGEERHLLSVLREGGAVKFRLRATQEKDDNLAARRGFDEGAARALMAYLNYSTPVASVPGAEKMSREQHRAERAAALEEAREYEERVGQHFGNWLPGSGYADATLFSYTSARRCWLTPESSSADLGLPDWQGPALHPYQNSDVRTLCASTGMILGWAVGLGKTFGGLACVAQLRRLGRITRPIFVVPAGLVGNWAGSARSALPSWRVVSIGMSPALNSDGSPRFKRRADGSVLKDERGEPIPEWTEDSSRVRRLKLGQVAAGQADLVIMSREAFRALPLSAENRERLISGDAQFLARIERREGYDGRSRRGRHDLLKRLTSFRAKCTARLERAGEHDLLFEHLGCDALIYDECHAYKNLYSLPTAFGESIRFLGGGAESDRALDAVLKGRLVRAGGGRTYGLSASWVKNSPLEIHSMIQLVADDLGDYGLDTNEALMEQYLTVEPRIITGMDGSVDVRPAVTGFRRLRELQAIIASKVIVRKPGQPGVVTRDGKPLHVPVTRNVEVTFDMSEQQSLLYRDLRTRARLASGGADAAEHLFSVMWEMRKLTSDPRLLGVGGRNPRFEQIAAEALKIRAGGGKTLVFLSIGEGEGSHARLRQALVDGGYPDHEIEIVSGRTHQGTVARQDLEDRYNHGDLTLVIGSEVLAEGFNLQRGTRAIMNADVPWNFQSLVQRLGRGARQGNAAESVLAMMFLMKGSFDAITYTAMKGKKAWEDQLDGETDDLINAAAESGTEDLALMMSEDPDATRLLIEARKLELAERSGKAAFKRRCQTLARAIWARRELGRLIRSASRRRHGWTTTDHLRVGVARRAATHARTDLLTHDLASFPLGRLIDYQHDVDFQYGLPLHQGLRFRLGEHFHTVTRFTPNDLSSIDEAGGLHTLTCREVARSAQAFEPSADPAHYVSTDPTTDIQPLDLQLSAGVTITVLNGRGVNPVPRHPDVLSVCVQSGLVESVTGANEARLRTLISLGATVIHYLTRQEAGTVHVERLVVLTPDSAAKQQTEGVMNSARFRERLTEIARLALVA